MIQPDFEILPVNETTRFPNNADKVVLTWFCFSNSKLRIYQKRGYALKTAKNINLIFVSATLAVTYKS